MSHHGGPKAPPWPYPASQPTNKTRFHNHLALGIPHAQNEAWRGHKTMKKPQQKWILGCLLVSSLGVAVAQNAYPPSGQSSGGWRRFEPSGPAADPASPPPEPQGPVTTQAPPPSALPSRVSLPAGTWVTIRVHEPIS